MAGSSVDLVAVLQLELVVQEVGTEDVTILYHIVVHLTLDVLQWCRIRGRRVSLTQQTVGGAQLGERHQGALTGLVDEHVAVVTAGTRVRCRW